jgi:hypothetical protein
MVVFSVRMYPNHPARNELLVKAETAEDALIRALEHFRSEDWRVKGTFFEVREQDEDGKMVFRCALSIE